MFNYFLCAIIGIAACGFAVAAINGLKPIIDNLKTFWQLFTCQIIGAFFWNCSNAYDY